MKFNFIGDVHGKAKELSRLIKTIPQDEKIIQLGDLGLGFNFFDDPFPSNFSYIRGNHDNPSIAIRDYPYYLGDFGFFHSMFYVSGARSMDYLARTEGINWWRDEELNILDLEIAIGQYKKEKPKIVFSHDCPRPIGSLINGQALRMTNTNIALETMFSEHEPSLWIFGHHHKPFDEKIGNTRFICLPELAVMKLEI